METCSTVVWQLRRKLSFISWTKLQFLRNEGGGGDNFWLEKKINWRKSSLKWISDDDVTSNGFPQKNNLQGKKYDDALNFNSIRSDLKY